MKTLREYIDLITEAPETDAPTKRFDTVAPAPQQAPAATPAPTTQAPAPQQAPAAAPAPQQAPAPHRYVPGATWNKGVLGIGSTGPEVDKLRQQLGLAPNGGKFDNETRTAVIQRQKELGITADGAWGPGTARADAAKPKQPTPSATAPTTAAPATGANDGDAGDAEARANQNRMTAPMATANDGADGEAEARAYQNRVPTASTGANDGDAGEGEARANQNMMPAAPRSPSTDVSKSDSVEVNINGTKYQMFLNTDGYYYIPGENTPRDQSGNNVYRPGERMPMQGPATAPFPRGYQGPNTPAQTGQVWTEGSGYDEVQRIVSLVHYR